MATVASTDDAVSFLTEHVIGQGCLNLFKQWAALRSLPYNVLLTPAAERGQSQGFSPGAGER